MIASITTTGFQSKVALSDLPGRGFHIIFYIILRSKRLRLVFWRRGRRSLGNGPKRPTPLKQMCQDRILGIGLEPRQCRGPKSPAVAEPSEELGTWWAWRLASPPCFVFFFLGGGWFKVYNINNFTFGVALNQQTRGIYLNSGLLDS